jgi:hypothetical protein
LLRAILAFDFPELHLAQAHAVAVQRASVSVASVLSNSYFYPRRTDWDESELLLDAFQGYVRNLRTLGSGPEIAKTHVLFETDQLGNSARIDLCSEQNLHDYGVRLNSIASQCEIPLRMGARNHATPVCEFHDEFREKLKAVVADLNLQKSALVYPSGLPRTDAKPTAEYQDTWRRLRQLVGLIVGAWARVANSLYFYAANANTSSKDTQPLSDNLCGLA